MARNRDLRQSLETSARFLLLILASAFFSWSAAFGAEPLERTGSKALEPALAAIVSAQTTPTSKGAEDEESAATESPATAFDEDPAAQKRGLELFRALCTGYCHSTSAKVKKDASFLFDCQADHGLSDTEIHKVIYDGIPDTRMQGFGGKLPDDDIWKLVSFMRQRRNCEG